MLIETAVDTGRSLWRERVARSADAPFLVGAGRTWTFGQADNEMLRIATGLAAGGVAHGTRVLVGMENRPETVLVHAALRELGAVLVPLLGGLTFAELAFQIRHSEAEVLIADEAIAATVLPHLDECPGVRHVVLETDLEAMLELDPLPAVELPGHGPRSPSAILYTSGSSGTPKGVVIPAGALPTVGAGYAGCFGITERDNYFLPLPLAHAVGALTPQGIALHAGCRLTVVDRFSPSRFWTDVEASRATCSILFPAQLNLLLELAADQPAASSLRLVMTHVWSSRFRDRFGVDIGVCWGMTETGAHSTGSPAGRHTERGDGYVGRPMLGVEIAVLGSGRTPLGSGETGEIALRHPHVMLEYLKDPEQTTRTLVDGWILSGDLGTIGEDGGLYYAGRSKNMIKRSGENISPEEIEGAIARYPAVVEALVFGVADPIRTEEIAAVIVVRPGAATEADDIIGHLRDHLARWKLPRYVALGEAALPRLANGKIDRMSVISSLDTATCWDRERTPKEAPTR